MTTPTWAEIKAIVKQDLDLLDEVFIDDDQLLGWVNSAIDEAEKHILGIYEDYFLQTETLSLAAGVSEYSLPANILGSKIRKVFYDNGSSKYEVKRVRNLSDIPWVDSDDDYRYLIINNSSGGTRLKLFPSSRETSSNVSIWYIGNANHITSDSDVINIPEAAGFIIASIKLECMRKELHPGQSTAESERERQRQLLVDALTSMVPDEDNEILIDTSFYRDFDNPYLY